MKRIYRRKLKTNGCITLLCILVSMLGLTETAFGQEVNHSGQTIVASQDTFYVEANRMFLKAQRDLKEGKANLFIIGGVSPIYYRGQKVFKRKYGIDYYDFGCVADYSYQEIREYNDALFLWLDENYGEKWQKDVRKDVVGFEKWVLYTHEAVPYPFTDPKPMFNGSGGGIYAMDKWVKDHMRYKETGTVRLHILLSEEGKVIDIDDYGVESPLTYSYVSAIKQAPSWSPGFHDGKPCRVVLTVYSRITAEQ